MDAVWTVLLSAVLTLLGTGLLQARHRHRLAVVEGNQRLTQALSEFGFALDTLILELQQLPPTRRRTVSYWAWIERHASGLDFFVGRLARVLFGRELYAAIERIQKATNELMLIAPPPALAGLQPIFEHLSSFADRGEDWFELLQQERATFAAVSRSLTTSEPFGPEPALGD